MYKIEYKIRFAHFVLASTIDTTWPYLPKTTSQLPLPKIVLAQSQHRLLCSTVQGKIPRVYTTLFHFEGLSESLPQINVLHSGLKVKILSKTYLTARHTVALLKKYK